jgi:vanillate O-demethylase monooxygenase subunit
MAFNEDREILEAVHIGMTEKTSRNINLGIDAASLQYRKLLDKAISNE